MPAGRGRGGSARGGGSGGGKGGRSREGRARQKGSDATSKPATVRYANFGQRAGASLLDTGVSQLLWIAVRTFLLAAVVVRIDFTGAMERFVIASADPATSLSQLGELLRAALLLIGAWLALSTTHNVAYYALQEGSRRQATVGKRVLRLKVVDAETLAPISRRRAAGRTLAKLVSLASLGLGYLAMLWHPQRRCWHDRIAGTAVIVADSKTEKTEKTGEGRAGRS